MLTGSFILHQRARQYEWSGDCFLSIKSFYNGAAHYLVNQRHYIVNEKNYLILNDCTKYNLTIDNTSVTESFCVFFDPDFVAKIISELNSTSDQLLDFSARRIEGFSLFERNYPHTGSISEALHKGRQRSSTMSLLEKEEFFHHLLMLILFQNNQSQKEIDVLSFKKKSTREEIYRRIFYAKDFIDSHYTDPLTLSLISEAAMLSPNHLLRNFQKIFGKSPFQYITQKKIAEAHRLITETEKSITEIVQDLGYSSMSNFSHYFKKQIGYGPLELRKKVMHRK